MKNYGYRKPAQEGVDYSKIIKSVKNPLGFFVLLLLIIESFLGLVIVLGGFGVVMKTVFVSIGILMAVAAGVAVFMLAWHKPENLTGESGTFVARGE